jgi:hypothetical protein
VHAHAIFVGAGDTQARASLEIENESAAPGYRDITVRD